jgi:hypothetical protein
MRKKVASFFKSNPGSAFKNKEIAKLKMNSFSEKANVIK